jgi:drug/metabolite transporter (DMT)-like permease
LGILPAALFSGLLGAVPYAIASSYSTSVAGTISAVFPAIGAIVAVIWFKEKLTALKFFGIIVCIVGTALLYGLAGFDVPFWVYLVALITAVGYALEGCFGYNMLRQDFDSSVTTTLRRVYLIAVFLVVLIIITLTTDTWAYLGQLISGFEVSNTSFAFLEPLVGSKIFIWAVFVLGSWCGGISYIVWYYSFE